jgi:hypothetical protein
MNNLAILEHPPRSSIKQPEIPISLSEIRGLLNMIIPLFSSFSVSIVIFFNPSPAIWIHSLFVIYSFITDKLGKNVKSIFSQLLRVSSDSNLVLNLR